MSGRKPLSAPRPGGGGAAASSSSLHHHGGGGGHHGGGHHGGGGHYHGGGGHAFGELSGWLLKAAPRLTDAGDKEDSLGRRVRRAANSLVAALLRASHYKRRYFVLDGAELRYYRDESCSAAAFSGVVDLHTVLDIRWAVRTGTPAFAFDLVTDARVFTLAPSPASEAAAAEWFNRIAHRLESARRRGMTARSLKGKTSSSSALRRMASQKGSSLSLVGGGGGGGGSGSAPGGLLSGGGSGGADGSGSAARGSGDGGALPLYSSHESAQVTPDALSSLEPNITAASGGAAAISSLATAGAASALLAVGASPAAAASATAALALPADGASIAPLLSAAVTGAVAGGALGGPATLARALAAAAEEGSDSSLLGGGASSGGAGAGGAGSSAADGSAGSSSAAASAPAWPRRGSLIYSPPDYAAPAPRVSEQPRRARPVVVSLAAAAGGAGFSGGLTRRKSMRFSTAAGSPGGRSFAAAAAGMGGSSLLYAYPTAAAGGGGSRHRPGAGGGAPAAAPAAGPPRRLTRTVSRWEELSGNVPRWALSVANDHHTKHVPLFAPLLGLGPGQAGWSDGAALLVAAGTTSAPGLGGLRVAGGGSGKDKGAGAGGAAAAGGGAGAALSKKEKKAAKKAAKKKAKSAGKSDGSSSDGASVGTSGGDDDDDDDDDEGDDAYGEGDGDWDAEADPAAGGRASDDEDGPAGPYGGGASIYAPPGGMDVTGLASGMGGADDGAFPLSTRGGGGSGATTTVESDTGGGGGGGSGTDTSAVSVAALNRAAALAASPGRPTSVRRVSAVYGAPLSRAEATSAGADVPSSSASVSSSAGGAPAAVGSVTASDALKRASANIKLRVAAMGAVGGGAAAAAAALTPLSAGAAAASGAGLAPLPAPAAAASHHAAAASSLPAARGAEPDLLLALSSSERAHVASMRAQATQSEERLGWRLRRGNGGPAVLPPDVIASSVASAAAGGWWAPALPLLQQTAAVASSAAVGATPIADSSGDSLSPLQALGVATAGALGLIASSSATPALAAGPGSPGGPRGASASIDRSSFSSSGLQVRSAAGSGGSLLKRGSSSASLTAGAAADYGGAGSVSSLSREGSVLGLTRGMSDLSGITAFATAFRGAGGGHSGPAVTAAALAGLGALSMPLPVVLAGDAAAAAAAGSGGGKPAGGHGASRPSSIPGGGVQRGLSNASLLSGAASFDGSAAVGSYTSHASALLPPIGEDASFLGTHMGSGDGVSGAPAALSGSAGGVRQVLLPPPGVPLLPPIAAAVAAAACPPSLLTHPVVNRPSRATGHAARKGRIALARRLAAGSGAAPAASPRSDDSDDDGEEDDDDDDGAGSTMSGGYRYGRRGGPAPLTPQQSAVGREIVALMTKRAVLPGPDGSLASGAAAAAGANAQANAKLRTLLARLGRDKSGFGLAPHGAPTGADDVTAADVDDGEDAASAAAAAESSAQAAGVGGGGVVDKWRPGGKVLLLADWGWEDQLAVRQAGGAPTPLASGPYLRDASGLPLAVAFRPSALPELPREAPAPSPPPASPAAVAASLRTMNRALAVWSGQPVPPAGSAASGIAPARGGVSSAPKAGLHLSLHGAAHAPQPSPSSSEPSSPSVPGARPPIVSLRPGSKLAFEPLGLGGEASGGIGAAATAGTGHILDVGHVSPLVQQRTSPDGSPSGSDDGLGGAGGSSGAAASGGGAGLASRAARRALALALSGGLASPPVEVGAEVILPLDPSATPLLCLGAGYGAVSHAVMNGWEDPRRTRGLPYSLPLPADIAVALRRTLRGPPGPRANTCGCALTADASGACLQGYNRDTVLAARAPSGPDGLPACDGSTYLSLDPWGDAGAATDDASNDPYEAALAHCAMHVLPAGTTLFTAQEPFAAAAAAPSSTRAGAARKRQAHAGADPRSLWILLQGRVRVTTAPAPAAVPAAAVGAAAPEGFLRAWAAVTATALALPANDAAASSSNGVQGGYDSDDGDSVTSGGGGGKKGDVTAAPQPTSLVLAGAPGTTASVTTDGSWWTEVSSAAAPVVLGVHALVDGFPHWATATTAEGCVMLELSPRAYARLCAAVPSAAAGLAVASTGVSPTWLVSAVPCLVAALADTSPRRGAGAAAAAAAAAATGTLAPADKWPLLSSLAATARPVVLAPGQALFDAGDIGDSAYVVVSGEVAASVPAWSHHPSAGAAAGSAASASAAESGSGHTLLAVFGRGSCVGECALVAPGPRSYRAVALTSTVLLRLSHSAVRAVLAVRPRLWRTVRNAVAWRDSSQLARMPLLAHLVGGQSNAAALAPLADLASPVVLSDTARPLLAPPAAWADAQAAQAALASLASGAGATGAAGAAASARGAAWHAVPTTRKRLAGGDMRALFLVASGTAEVLPQSAVAAGGTDTPSGGGGSGTPGGGQRQAVPAGEWLGGATLYTSRHTEELAGLTYAPGSQPGGDGSGGTPTASGGAGGSSSSSVAAALGPAAGSLTGTCVLLALTRHHLDAFISSLPRGPERLAAWRATAGSRTGSGVSGPDGLGAGVLAASGVRRGHARVDALGLANAAIGPVAGGSGASSTGGSGGGIMLAAAVGGGPAAPAGGVTSSKQAAVAAGASAYKRSAGLPPARAGGGGDGAGRQYPKSMKFGDNPIAGTGGGGFGRAGGGGGGSMAGTSPAFGGPIGSPPPAIRMSPALGGALATRARKDSNTSVSSSLSGGGGSVVGGGGGGSVVSGGGGGGTPTRVGRIGRS